VRLDIGGTDRSRVMNGGLEALVVEDGRGVILDDGGLGRREGIWEREMLNLGAGHMLRAMRVESRGFGILEDGNCRWGLERD
jgi:hypothetical protein